ncbi:membrane-bound alpha-1,6 mannosyltransferase initiation-specific [Metschnikowia bicuspidata var. bicuspidata NRRL YB-4993]|uniref:Membrane-bound alpha-1,6 mannosyltransferase initiation-specific n=1 Tax=Metschnikowia bicuspidata var. bicuspidata NRRL YB-4993 TaxID=869754 RepID=A0A1A0H8D6_9ASCO|nr:membrane-bound alpha-1,6 mannosyltransferase initiation-specific [Metschnikowia bicuspidata var. bicuspidata NRRL YB-4993]OBA20286.1 membrane-bound alpha-1,6 mannosyltransferase initiation-specific [Metschnikowia bicuspidata var. bicuspidata NRRL YB-4993]
MGPSRRKARLLAAAVVLLFYTCYRTFGSTLSARQPGDKSRKLQFERVLQSQPDWRQDGINFQSARHLHMPPGSALHRQLEAAFPYEPQKGFPKTIWQTWKVGLEDGGFPSRYRGFQESWDQAGYSHHVLSDQQCDGLVRQLFEPVPDVVHAWQAMPKSILKADFFRYLVLYACGGVYSDIDTTALKPVDVWVSGNRTLYGRPNNAGLVVGIEADPDRPDWADWYARRIQFCKWTLQAKKGHPMLRGLIARITQLTLERKKNGQLAAVLGKDPGGDVMDWTGPGIFTDTVLAYMNGLVQPDALMAQPQDKHEPIVTWRVLTGMAVPLVLEDVLVLPITCFSPGVGHMGSRPTSDRWAYVQHVFLGSWKEKKAGKQR